MGAWSGMNFANEDEHEVGSFTDGFGILAEVKKVCQEQPSNSVASATFMTFKKLSPR
jgi:hypothetical protein